MAPAIKLIDKRPGEPNRHHEVYRAFGRIGVAVKKVHDAKGAFYAIVNDENLENVLTQESKDVFRGLGYEVVPPIEYNALKTVVAKNLGYMIVSYTDTEIIESIETLNEWAEVESVFRIPVTSKMLKVRFKNNQMAQQAMQKGMVILHQYIPPTSIEKEIFVKLVPCRNCYGYDPRDKDCMQEKKVRCPYCAGEHMQRECTTTEPKCINCGGQHRTLAAACRIRKEIIKNKSKEYRERSKSRKRQQESYATAVRTGATYASTSATNAATQNPDTTPLTAEETKLIVTTIMSAVVYAQYMEAVEPGSYQKNIDEMYKLNGLPPVKFPPPKMTETVTKVCRELFQQQAREQEEECSREQMSDNAFVEGDISDEAIASQEMEIDRMIKHHRDSITPPNLSEQKRKKEGESSTAYSEVKPPVPPKRPTTTGPHGAESEGALPQRDKAREKTKQEPRPRTSSTSSVSSQPDRNITKEVGLTVYIGKSSKLDITSKNPNVRNEIRKAILKNEAKFTWKNPKAERENILGGFNRGRFDLNEIEYRRVEDHVYEKIISKCTGIYGQQHTRNK